MKDIFYNRHNLKDHEIDEKEVRVKAIIINDKDEILLGHSYNDYQFPGGHLISGETKKECLIREVKEETGIELSFKELEPFMKIRYYSKSKKNKDNVLYYYLVKTNKQINFDKTNYSKRELEGNYYLLYVNIYDVDELLIDNANKHPETKSISYEMLEVISEYIDRR